MGNTIALKLLTEHGQEVIADSRAHLLDWELSMLAWFSGCLIRAVPTEDGILTWDRIRPLVKPVGPHSAPTGAIEIENTHNMAGGRVYPQDTIDEICDEAHYLAFRCIWMVPVYSTPRRRPESRCARIVQKVDTVMFCLSKALGAPAGSMLAGRKPLIDKARLLRKRLGGGMRQVGVLAAPGLLALEESPKGLGQDHANAQLLAERLRTIDGIRVFPVETNIVIFDVSSTRRHPRDISRDLREQGVLINGLNDRLMRAVTHYGVSTAQCSEAMERLESLCVSAAREGILR